MKGRGMNFWMGKAQSKDVSAYDGAIFLCNYLTRKECFDRKIFGLSSKCADFIQKVKSGATLFLYDVDQRKLHGVFEATSDGAMNIIPDAYPSSGFHYPCQIRFKRIWFCQPLMEREFEDAVQNNYFSRNRFNYGLSHQQVVKLLHLFSSRNRLQPRQNPRLQDEPPRECETSSVISQTDNQSGSNSSHGSLKSPCQTCTSSTVGEDAASLSHKLAKPMSIMHRELQPDISDVAKSNSSRSSLHTAGNTDIVTESGTQEAVDDESTEDYIPLQLEEDDGVDNLSDLLGDESQSSESKSSSDSEGHTTFHRPCGRKKDDCDQPIANSKLRADTEGRKSVFARLIERPKSLSQRDKAKTKSFASMKARSFGPLSQRKKRRKAHQNKPFPRDNSATIDIPLADKVKRIPALNKFSGGKPSNIQTGQHPYVRENVNKWDVCTKEPDRSNASRKLFDPEDGRKLVESCDRELNKSPLFAEVHESCEVTGKEETRTPFSDFKRRAKDPNVEGGETVFDTEDVDEAARKKMRLASASYQREEYQSETALVPKDAKPTDILTISDGDCKLNSIGLSSNDTSTQMARAYLETEVLMQDEQQRIQGCCEDVTSDKLLILEDFGDVPKLSFGNRQPVLNVDTRSEVAFGHLETETTLQEKQNQSAKSCNGVFNNDKMLLLEKPETIDFSPNHDEDCGSKMCLTSDVNHSIAADGNTRNVASSHLVPEMLLHQKHIPSVQSCSKVVHGYEALVPENSEEMLPKSNCERNKSLSSDEVYNHVEASHLETDVSLQEKPYQRAPSSGEINNAADQVLCQENSVTLDTAPKCDGDRGKNSLSSDGIGGYVASDCPSPERHGDSAHKNILLDRTLELAPTDPQETSKLPQDELFLSISGVDSSVSEHSGTVDTCRDDVDSAHKTSFHQKDAEATYSPTGSENHEDTKPMDILTISEGSCEHKSTVLSPNDTRTQMAGTYPETEVLLQDEDEQQRTRGCCEDVTGERSLILEDSGKNLLPPKLISGSMQATVETRSEVDVGGHVETETPLQEKQNQSARGCYGVVDPHEMLHQENPETMDLSPNHDEDGILQMLAADHQGTVTILPQGKHAMYFCGDTCGTVDTATGEGDCEHMTSFYQKVAEASYLPIGSEDHEDTTDIRRYSPPPYDQELSEPVPQLETLYQNLPSILEAAYENSDSTDPFAVRADGYGGKTGIATDSTSAHLVVTDLLGTNSESRTGFFDGSSSELAEMVVLAHDTGEELMEPH